MSMLVDYLSYTPREMPYPATRPYMTRRLHSLHGTTEVQRYIMNIRSQNISIVVLPPGPMSLQLLVNRMEEQRTGSVCPKSREMLATFSHRASYRLRLRRPSMYCLASMPMPSASFPGPHPAATPDPLASLPNPLPDFLAAGGT